MRLGETERIDFWPYLPARDLLDFLRVAQTSRMERARQQEPACAFPTSRQEVQRVVDLALSAPPGEASHWTGRMLAKAAGVSLRSVQRILEAHQLAPHRIRTFKLSNDPKFAEKLKDIVGLYVDPPAHAVVLSVDEKSQIQALDRTQPGLPMKPGRAGTMTHDYKRHGTTTLFAALNVLDGTVIGQNMKRHPPSGVHPLPQRHRSAGAEAKGDPCHRR